MMRGVMREVEFLQGLKKYMEEVEQKIEWEWGNCNSLETMVAEGMMPSLYYEVLGRLKEIEDTFGAYTED